MYERISTASTSATMTKRRTDKGQPCVIPRLLLNGSDIQQLLDITEVIFEYITFTHNKTFLKHKFLQ